MALNRFFHTRNSGPWEKWELDQDFLRSLSYHSITQSDFQRDSLLDNLQFYLDVGKDLMELIPEDIGLLPAKGFVKALASLVQKVKRAKGDVYNFAKKVVNWVGQVRTAFESTDGGCCFTWTTWQHLRTMRDLIDEICQWAHSQLKDGRWFQIGNGLRVGKEIEEFRARLNDAQNLFRDLTMINLSGGMDAIYGAVVILLNLQDSVSVELERIRHQQEEHLVYIRNEIEEQKQSQNRQAFFADHLDRHVVTNPTFDEQGKHPCDPDTRVAELADIKKWFHAIAPGSQNFLWLTGDPGCGKSAITATLAEYCLNQPEDILFAQFFINRNNADSIDPNSYFPTIARQLGKKCTDIERIVFDNLKQRPGLALRMSADQAAKLFVDALAVAAKPDKDRIVAVIIDGLDETDRTRLHDTAIIFSQLFKALIRYPNVKVFISSRTEDDIRNPFARNLKDESVKHIHLDTTDSVDDVATYMRRQLGKMVERYDLNWGVWPGEDRMSILATRASGLFIWAVTAVRYLQERIEEECRDCLDRVLNDLTGEALKGINSIYSLILQQKKHSTDWEFDKFRRIIGAIIVLREPLCLDDLIGLLNLCHGPASTPVDVIHFVRRLRTILVMRLMGRQLLGYTSLSLNLSLTQNYSTNCQLIYDFMWILQWPRNSSLCAVFDSILMLPERTKPRANEVAPTWDMHHDSVSRTWMP